LQFNRQSQRGDNDGKDDEGCKEIRIT